MSKLKSSFDHTTLPSAPAARRAAEAEVMTLAPGEDMRMLLADDEQAPVVIDATSPPGSSPPLHSHPWAVYEVVIEGALRMRIAGEEFDLGPGDACYTPANAPHSFVVTSETDVRVVAFSLPGGAEFYRRLAGLASGGSPDPDTLQELGEQFGAQILGPPMSAC